jgi:5-methylcytosine-specific restriction endonuclease McrA
MTHELILSIWRKAKPMQGLASNQFRCDAFGNYIAFNEYGKNSTFGWEIDHIFPKSLGGNDHVTNLQPLHWKANRKKGNSLLFLN